READEYGGQASGGHGFPAWFEIEHRKREPYDTSGVSGNKGQRRKSPLCQPDGRVIHPPESTTSARRRVPHPPEEHNFCSPKGLPPFQEQNFCPPKGHPPSRGAELLLAEGSPTLIMCTYSTTPPGTILSDTIAIRFCTMASGGR